jgi:hypothetical protein
MITDDCWQIALAIVRDHGSGAWSRASACGSMPGLGD